MSLSMVDRWAIEEKIATLYDSPERDALYQMLRDDKEGRPVRGNVPVYKSTNYAAELAPQKDSW